ncbi:MAG: cytochrome c oxidase accessory protein CcoG [Gammaproteobacteria bacterium]
MNAGTPISGKSVGGDADVQDFLYQKRQKIYPREVHGLFARLRVAAVVLLLGLYYGVPWLTWNGRQAVLFDMPGRKFHLFGITLWPQDFFYLAALLIIAALSLFFFTALAGRVWCGFACPQTVWTETFLWIEQLIEGDRQQQIKLDKAPLSARKFAIKSAKHSAWILYALFTGFTFVGYFTPIRELAWKLWTFNTGPWETFWVFFYSFATYGNAGWLREQVCIYMCPYARFQSAMFDKDTLIISYDQRRGEPRGSRRRGADHRGQGLGDCIDCTLCVQVCPTGIDIRNGLQYQCIACAACVDACDQVMGKMNYPKGLIRYTTEHALQGQATKVVRLRVIVYATLLVGIFCALIYAVAARTPLVLDVIRDRNVLYREGDAGLVSNVYTLKIVNMDQRDHTYHLSASGVEGLEVEADRAEYRVPAGEVLTAVIDLKVDPVNLKQASTKVKFRLAAVDDAKLAVEETARFIGPTAR